MKVTQAIEFATLLTDKLNSKLDIIHEEIERNFINIYNHVVTEE